MNTSLCCKLIRLFICLSLAASLSGCNDAPKVAKHPKYIKTAKSKPESNVKNIKPSDEQEQSEVKDTLPDYDTGLSSDAKPQALLVLEYKSAGEHDMRQSYLLIPAAADNAEFPELLETLSQLAENKSVLHNIHITNVINKSTEMAISAVNNKKLPAENEIGLDLQLIKFFIDSRQRDAAYIMVDNTKKILASLSGPGAREKAKRLSSELEILESDMRKTMPFTL